MVKIQFFPDFETFLINVFFSVWPVFGQNFHELLIYTKDVLKGLKKKTRQIFQVKQTSKKKQDSAASNNCFNQQLII